MLVTQGLVKDIHDWNTSDRVENVIKVSDGEEHGNTVAERGTETDGDSGHDGDWNPTLWFVHLLGHVSGTVKTREGPSWVDKTNDEGHTRRAPASTVVELDKDEVSILVVTSCANQYSKGDDNKRQEGSVESSRRDGWQWLVPNVEKGKEGVEDFKSNKHFPCLWRLSLTCGEVVHTNNGCSNGDRDGCRCEDGSKPSVGTTHVSPESSILLWGQLESPVVLTTRVLWEGRDQLREGDTDTGSNESDDDDTVDDKHWSTGGDTSNEGGGDTKPRIGKTETDTKQGPNVEVLS